VPVDPEFTANAVDILYSTDACAPTLSCAPLLSNKPPTTVEPFGSFTLARWTFDDAQTWGFLSLGAPASQGMGLHAITLVDTRVDVFQQVTLPPWKRVLSSDIKLYENQNVLPRAFMTEEDGVVVAKDTESALAIIRDVNFNPSTMIVLQSQPDQNIFLGGNATLPQYLTRLDAPITSYSPERIEIQIENPGSSRFLLLTDTYYPGWTATVNGESKPIYKADVMFRAVQVPAGKSTVVFEYKPAWWPGILILGAAVWLLALLCGFALFRNPIKFTDKVSLE
jgi:hypothetical protein